MYSQVFQSTEEAREIALRALQLAAATKGLKTRLGLADPDGELRQINVMDTRLGEGCPPLPSCPLRLGKYRTHDGSCNNPRRPWIGRAMSPTQRLLHPHYDDGMYFIFQYIFFYCFNVIRSFFFLNDFIVIVY